ncbi:SH3 domain-containing protein [Fistulina hepatica ATCC 64428]|uniref:SH3 domain-containing protein n=1 Tax=Fistulina hepatica ATCC 64428 TaxID=1128425 RepID=A0A0D7A5J8_9AGAR|nr:SH3 domain-containing protein [Fistulina hepatica ATCC 64428]
MYSRHATGKSIDGDRFHGSKSRDFCNSFWGVGDTGVNILFARVRGALKTTDELRNFWKERALIEEEYAARLATLAQMSVGKDEIGHVGLRSAVDTLMYETEKQARAHSLTATQIRKELETPTTQLYEKQIDQERHQLTPLEAKFKDKQSHEMNLLKARERYEGDRLRIASYVSQSKITHGKELERIQAKLLRAEHALKENERAFEKHTKNLSVMMPAWEKSWRDFCDACQDIEEERMDFFKDALWAYANEVSLICVADDESCERIRTMLDEVETFRDIENFVSEYGTGNQQPNPPRFVPGNGNGVSSSTIVIDPNPRIARYPRNSRRGHMTPPNQTTELYRSYSRSGGSSDTRAPPTSFSTKPESSSQSRGRSPEHVRSKRESQPLPQPREMSIYRPEVQSPTSPPEHLGGGVLFYVKALYDYTATIPEEFDFQAGDVIAVTATPDDGWWSGVLLDEARREEGRHVFPSNFVCLF